jgi:hypothetical protein
MGLIIPLIIFVGFAAIIVWMADWASGARRYVELADLNRRLASGEIERTEYEEKRKTAGKIRHLKRRHKAKEAALKTMRPFQDWTRQKIEHQIDRYYETITTNEKHAARNPQAKTAYNQNNEDLKKDIRELRAELEYRETHGITD